VFFFIKKDIKGVYIYLKSKKKNFKSFLLKKKALINRK